MQEFLTNFGVDWKLLLAQVVNFFILLVLLKKFAYQPILAMLKKRSEEIRLGLLSSKEAQEKLAGVKEFEKQSMIEAEKKALGVVNAAEDIGKKNSEKIVADGVKKSEMLVADGRKLLDQEKLKMSSEVWTEAETLIKMGVMKVLGKQDATTRDKELIAEALRELKAVNVR